MNYLFRKPTLHRPGASIPALLWGVLLLLFIVSTKANALPPTVPTSITLSGACLGGTYVLDKVSDNYDGTGKPAYQGSGTVTVGTTTTGTTITIYYESSGPAWVMAFDGQPYQSNPATSSIPPTTGWVVVDNSAGVGNCNGTLNVATEAAAAGTLTLLPTAVGPVCAGRPVSLTATTTNLASPVAYAWSSSPAGISGTGTNAVIALSTPSVTTNTTFVVTVTATSGATSATASASVSVNPIPGLAIGAGTDPTTCGGSNGSIAFTTTNLPNGSYSLSYTGAGSPKTVTVSGNAFTLTGLAAGMYSSFSITNGGCTGSVATSRTLANPVAPVLTLSTAASLCVGQSVMLSATGGFSSYTFTGSSGPVGSGATNMTTVSGLPAGPYSFSVAATAPNGCTNTASASVTINSLPVPTLAVSGTITCAQLTQTLTAGGGTTYTFAGPGIVAQNTATGSATVSAGGLYSVTVTTSGCSATTTITVSEDKNAPTMPTLTASPSTTLTCAQTSLTLTASATGTGLSYAFSGPGGSLPGTGNSRAVSVAGSYSVTITGANGCTTSQSTVIYSNTTAPTATLTASSTAVCSPASITLTAGGGVSYTFSAGASQIGTTNQAVVTQSGLYSVTVAGANGCTSTTSITVAINPLPSAPTLTGASRSIIQSNTPLSLLGFVTADNGNTLSFSGLTGLLNPPTVDISQTGVLNFQVTQTSISGCTSLATPFSLTIQPSIPANQTACRSSVVVLSSITPGSRFEWYKNGQSAPFKLTEIASIQKGTQTASLTIVSTQTTANYYLKIFAANGSFVFEGPFRVAVDYSCTGARQAAPELTDVPLSVTLTSNPITDGKVRAIVRGAGGQALTVTLFDLRGQPAGEQRWPIADSEQAIELPISTQPSGVYLLQAQTPDQRKTIRVIKP